MSSWVTDSSWTVIFWRGEMTVTSIGLLFAILPTGKIQVSRTRTDSRNYYNGTSFLGTKAASRLHSKNQGSPEWVMAMNAVRCHYPHNSHGDPQRQSAADWQTAHLDPSSSMHLRSQPVLQAIAEFLVMEVQVKSRWRLHMKPITSMRDGSGERIWSLIKRAIEGGLVSDLGQDSCMASNPG